MPSKGCFEHRKEQRRSTCSSVLSSIEIHDCPLLYLCSLGWTEAILSKIAPHLQSCNRKTFPQPSEIVASNLSSVFRSSVTAALPSVTMSRSASSAANRVSNFTDKWVTEFMAPVTFPAPFSTTLPGKAKGGSTVLMIYANSYKQGLDLIYLRWAIGGRWFFGISLGIYGLKMASWWPFLLFSLLWED